MQKAPQNILYTELLNPFAILKSCSLMEMLPSGNQFLRISLDMSLQTTQFHLNNFYFFQNDRIPPLTPIEMDTDYQIFTDTETSTNNMESVDDDNIIEDSDDGTSLSDAIIQLQNIEEPERPIDTSTLQLLQEHGISMIPSDESDSSLITNAIQSGRKLVLSEAGKIVLNDPKFRKMFTDSPPHPSQAVTLPKPDNSLAVFQSSSSSSPVKIVQKKMPILPSKNFPLKTNKVIKILSAEQFKQICGGDLTNALKKFTNDSGVFKTSAEVKLSSGKQTATILQINNSKIKRNLTNKSKFNITQSQNHQSSNINIKNLGFKLPPVNTQPTNIIIPETHNIEHDELDDSSSNQNTAETHQYDDLISIEQSPSQQDTNTDDLISVSPSYTTPTASRTPNTSSNQIYYQTQTPMSMSEMEKQLLELKKLMDDMRRKMEVLQKENYDFRIRITSLESERNTHLETTEHSENNNGDEDDVDNTEILNFMS